MKGTRRVVWSLVRVEPGGRYAAKSRVGRPGGIVLLEGEEAPKGKLDDEAVAMSPYAGGSSDVRPSNVSGLPLRKDSMLLRILALSSSPDFSMKMKALNHIETD